jgi:hypothetical protein
VVLGMPTSARTATACRLSDDSVTLGATAEVKGAGQQQQQPLLQVWTRRGTRSVAVVCWPHTSNARLSILTAYLVKVNQPQPPHARAQQQVRGVAADTLTRTQ